MNPTRDVEPTPVQDRIADPDDPLAPVGPAPTLLDLTDEGRSRIVRFIVTSALERGLAPTAVVALYADLTGDDLAVRYADQRFMLRTVPSDWREVENRVFDLEEGARARGLDLATAWRRAMGVAVPGQDVMEQLARLAGMPASARRGERSIFDDPEDLDALEDEDAAADALQERLAERLPDLLDLTADAQRRLRRFAIEERLERGLPASELLDLYRGFEMGGDDRAQQYLDRVYVEHAPPGDWLDLQSDARRVLDMAESRGRDAGHMYADLLRGSPGIDPVVALQLLIERLSRMA
jgi:hypothetical protein